jgi:hypothetical protein
MRGKELEEQGTEQMQAPSIDAVRREYFEERQSALNEQFQATLTMIRTLLSIAGGALLLSITFIKEITGGVPREKIWLRCSWFLFIVTIVLTLVSLYLSRKGAQNYVNRLTRFADGDASVLDERNWSYVLLEWFSIVSVLSLVSGVGFLTYFSFINM